MANFTITLTNRTGGTVNSETLISWAWFDSIDLTNLGSPTDKGSAESTDGSGVLTISAPNSTLNPGQAGTLLIMSNDFVESGAYFLDVTS